MRILICTSNGGQGLMAGSEALKECISELQRESSVVIKDFPTEARCLSRILVNDVYNLSLKLNISLSTLYVRIGELMRFSDWGPALEDTGRVRRTILKEEPDIVVITSPWVSRSIARALRDSGTPVYSVVLDFGQGLPLGWACNDVTQCIAPTDDAMDILIHNGMSRNILKRGGILVHPRYLKSPNSEYDHGRVLVVSGREGCSNSYHIARALLSSTKIKRIDVLCGRNMSLRKRVEAIEDSRVNAHGFVDDILPFYEASQVVVSKAGSFTVAECLAVKRPLLVDATHGIMSQETGNTQLVKEKGIGIVVGETKDIVEQAELLIDNPDIYESFRERIEDARDMLDPYGVAKEILGVRRP